MSEITASFETLIDSFFCFSIIQLLSHQLRLDDKEEIGDKNDKNSAAPTHRIAQVMTTLYLPKAVTHCFYF